MDKCYHIFPTGAQQETGAVGGGGPASKWLSRVGMPSNTRAAATAPVCREHSPAEAAEGLFPTKNSRGTGQGVLCLWILGLPMPTPGTYGGH